MNHVNNTSSRGLLELLRDRGELSIPELKTALHITNTAVRQRLARLMNQGLIQRTILKQEVRGRPSHRYSLTEKGRRQGGSNFADLTLALWQEVRGISDPEVRQGLLKRIAKIMAQMYGGRLQGQNTEERMQEVANLMADRNVSFTVDYKNADRSVSVGQRFTLPVLTAQACPYPELAEQDRGICAVEKMMFSELLGEKVRLSECRLDGASCCRFETN